MNESGRAIASAAKFYKSPLDQVVVFHDEMDLAPGRFRMKTGGGAAGHNGLRSIIGQMGPNFRRARMGVGHPGDKDMVLGWVLSDFNKVDGPWVETLCRACADAAPLLAATEDEKYQTEVMRLAPSPKADPRKAGLVEGVKPAN
jgi:PTH1 family peptidyl-tRNA hydrolase